MKSASLLAIVIMLLIFSTVQTTTWYVHPDSTLNSIQAGLDSCTTNDTVLVGPGTYYENIIWPNIHGIDLLSELGSDSTIIDGDSTGSVIVVSNRTDVSTCIKYFTIRNGCADIGGGILCANHSAPTILGNIITDNTTSGTVYRGGAGIACIDTSEPYIVSNTIMNNSACSSGGGIMCNHYSSPHILLNTIEGNLACYGSGVFCDNFSSPIISANIVRYNHFPSLEGVNKLANSYRIDVDDFDLRRTPFQGGGICLWRGCTSYVDQNYIFGNSTMGWGGGIGCLSSSPIIFNNTIVGNTANDYGGGIGCTPDTNLLISWNIIIANEARNGGGIAVLYSSGAPEISNNTITANDSDGIYCNNATPIINNNNIVNNARYGVHNVWPGAIVNAVSNWWGDSTGPYHPTLNPSGLGDTVSDYVDFDPWLTDSIVTVEERPILKPVMEYNWNEATIFCGPIQLPAGKKCRVFDITGRVVMPDKIEPGIYFIEVDGVVIQKMIKIK